MGSAGLGDSDHVVLVVAMGRRSSAVAVFLVGTLLVVGFLGGLDAGKLSEEELADLDLTEEERAVLMLDGEESDDDFDYNPLGKSQNPEEEDVVVLTPDEFDDFVKGNQYVLVEFVAPWCGHCQKLTPEYAKAAAELKYSGVVLAKVDAVEHADFADDLGVKGYPTLFFYIDGVKKPYTGGRSRLEFCLRLVLFADAFATIAEVKLSIF